MKSPILEPESQLAPRRDGDAEANAIDADGPGLAKICGPHKINSVRGREPDLGAVDLPVQASGQDGRRGNPSLALEVAQCGAGRPLAHQGDDAGGGPSP